MKPEVNAFLEDLSEAMEWEDITLTLDTRFKELPEWDSLSFLSLLTIMRNEYGVGLDVQAFNEIETFADLYQLIER